LLGKTSYNHFNLRKYQLVAALNISVQFSKHCC